MATDSFVKRSRVLLAAMLVFFMVPSSYAVDKKPPEPNPSDNPMLARYIKDGIKLYYMGNRSGLDGWFLLKDGQLQIVYTTPDRQSLLIGALYSTEGDEITEEQIRSVYANHPEINASVQSSVQQMQQSNLMAMPAVSPAGILGVPASPGEKLVQDLQQVGSVDLGDHRAPQLFMIMDPNCPHCQATWKALRQAVLDKTLQIKFIPIGRNDEDERAAAVLLKIADPLNAWDKYVGGDKTQLAGSADPVALGAIRANHVLIDRWNINETPYIVYRGKDKKVKIIVGEPQKVENLLGDLGPG